MNELHVVQSEARRRLVDVSVKFIVLLTSVRHFFDSFRLFLAVSFHCSRFKVVALYVENYTRSTRDGAVNILVKRRKLDYVLDVTSRRHVAGKTPVDDPYHRYRGNKKMFNVNIHG